MLVLHGPGGSTRGVGKQVEVQAGAIGERVELEIAPEVFDRIEFGRVRRQQFRAQTRMFADEVLHLTGAVSRQSIPDEYCRGAQLPIELAQKLDDERRIDVSRVQPEIKMHGVACWRDAQCPDDGDLLVQAVALPEHGRAAARTPAAAHQRRHQQPGFVDEHQPGFQVRSVFFTRGQSTLTQRRMASSSRSMARRVGFCGLQPNPLRSRPIWST